MLKRTLILTAVLFRLTETKAGQIDDKKAGRLPDRRPGPSEVERVRELESPVAVPVAGALEAELL